MHDETADASGTTENLPAITTISLDCVGSRGKRYRGQFTFKVPSLGEQIQIGNLKSTRLPNGAGGDVKAFLLCEQICYLQVCLRDPIPSWWQPWDFYDEEPVQRLYAEAIAYANRFLGINTKARNDPAENTEPAEDPSSESMADSDGARASVSLPPKRRTIVSSQRP